MYRSRDYGSRDDARNSRHPQVSRPPVRTSFLADHPKLSDSGLLPPGQDSASITAASLPLLITFTGDHGCECFKWLASRALVPLCPRNVEHERATISLRHWACSGQPFYENVPGRRRQRSIISRFSFGRHISAPGPCGLDSPPGGEEFLLPGQH